MQDGFNGLYSINEFVFGLASSKDEAVGSNEHKFLAGQLLHEAKLVIIPRFRAVSTKGTAGKFFAAGYADCVQLGSSARSGELLCFGVHDDYGGFGNVNVRTRLFLGGLFQIVIDSG